MKGGLHFSSMRPLRHEGFQVVSIQGLRDEGFEG